MVYKGSWARSRVSIDVRARQWHRPDVPRPGHVVKTWRRLTDLGQRFDGATQTRRRWRAVDRWITAQPMGRAERSEVPDLGDRCREAAPSDVERRSRTSTPVGASSMGAEHRILVP